MTSSNAFLTFTVQDQRYALAIEDVVEVAPMIELMQTPSDNPAFVGVANRHGAPLPMLDLRQVFNQESTTITEATLFVVGRTQTDDFIGLLVDEIHQVDYITNTQIKTTVGAEKFIRGIISSNSILTQVIAIDPLVTVYLSDAVVDEIFKV